MTKGPSLSQIQIDKPSRTVVTAEIGKSASRMRHLIKHDDGTYRTLFPIETERLNMFPDNWTKVDDAKGRQIADSKRGFMMGNALVVGIIQRLREPLKRLIHERANEKNTRDQGPPWAKVSDK